MYVIPETVRMSPLFSGRRHGGRAEYDNSPFAERSWHGFNM